MIRKTEASARPDNGDRAPHRLWLPGFIGDQEIGLGDVIKRSSSYLGLKPCGGCGHRADAFNRWLVFTNRQQK